MLKKGEFFLSAPGKIVIVLEVRPMSVVLRPLSRCLRLGGKKKKLEKKRKEKERAHVWERTELMED